MIIISHNYQVLDPNKYNTRLIQNSSTKAENHNSTDIIPHKLLKMTDQKQITSYASTNLHLEI